MGKEEGKGGFSWANILIAAIISAGILYAPAMLTGHAISGQIPDIQGRWNVTETITMDPIYMQHCENYGPVTTHFYDVYQTEDQIEITAPPYVFNPPREKPTVSDFDLKGKFLTQTSLSGDLSFTIPSTGDEGSGGSITGHITQFTLSKDCNSASFTGHWIFEGSVRCEGPINATLTRLNPTGCGYKCIANYTCSDFSECADGTQERTCTDSSNCEIPSTKTETQACQVAQAPAPVPEQGSSIGVYAIIILVLLIIAAAGAILWILFRKKSRENVELVKRFRAILLNIDMLADSDRQRAFDMYKEFSKMFSEYSGKLGENEKQMIYNEGMALYKKLSGQ